MYPIICTIGPFSIYSYGLMLAIGFIIASALVCRQAKRQKINPDIIFNFCLVVLVSGIIGARLFYVGRDFHYYARNPWEIMMVQQGGLSWYGGLILGVFSGVIYLKRKKMAIYQILDLIVPFVALAQASGRIGCLLNGCCFGRPSEFGFYFPVHGKALIPTQLYSSLGLLFIFVFLRFLQARPHREGEIFLAYLFLYTTKRFFMEFWRGDSEIVLFGLTFFQLVSIFIFVAALFLLIGLRKKDAGIQRKSRAE